MGQSERSALIGASIASVITLSLAGVGLLSWPMLLAAAAVSLLWAIRSAPAQSDNDQRLLDVARRKNEREAANANSKGVW